MSLTQCKECKKEVSTSAEKCPHCGVQDPAFVKCKKCKKEVSPSAEKCPHCGEKNPAIKTPILGLLIMSIIIIVAIAYCSSDSDDEPTVTNASNNEQTVTKSKSPTAIALESATYLCILLESKNVLVKCSPQSSWGKPIVSATMDVANSTQALEACVAIKEFVAGSDGYDFNFGDRNYKLEILSIYGNDTPWATCRLFSSTTGN